jgi:uncharacterized membrane protein
MHFSRERGLILAAATTIFGLSAFLRKIGVDRVPPLHYQIVSATVYVASLPFLFLLANSYESDQQINYRSGLFWIVIATVAGMIGNVLFCYALRSSSEPGVATVLASASPIVTLMLTFVFMGERPSLQTAMGCALVLLGIILVSSR